MRAAVLTYGVVVYAFFFVTFTYAIGFVGNFIVPKSMDGGRQAPLLEAIVINSLLLAAFAVQHTIMARPRFKAWLTRSIPQAAERSTFVLLASAILALIMWQWRPIGPVIWSVDATWARWLLNGISLAGWGLVLYSTFLIDHFDLFGLRQVWLYARGREYTHHPFIERSVYKVVRHPLMLGFLVAFWATPQMTGGHLLFAGLITAYILVGIRFEERDLVRHLGDAYLRYRERTPALFPQPWRKRRERGTVAPALVPVPAPGSATKWLGRLSVAGFAFFLAKGMLWLCLMGAIYLGWTH